MEDNISIIVVVILAVIIIVLFPIYNVATRQDSVTNNMVVKATTNFVDDVRTKGYITKEAYQSYVNNINATGNMYEIEMEVHAPMLLKTDNEDSYSEDYEVTYTDDILEKLDDIEMSDKSILKSGVYRLNENDQFYVRVKNTNITQAQMLLSRIFGGATDTRIFVDYGGTVYASEWETSEYRNSTGYNLSLSRPRDLSGTNGKDYKYETIFSGVDPLTGEIKETYGIAARLKDDETADNRGIRFELKYTNVIFKNSSGAVVSDIDQIKTLIRNNLKIAGFKADTINIRKIGGTGNTYTFIIDLTDIELYFNQSIAMGAYIEISSGFAEAIIGKNDDGSYKTSEVGTMKSKEFVVFYEVRELNIEYVVKYYNGSTEVVGKGETDNAKVFVKLNKTFENIEAVKYSAGDRNITYFSTGNGINIRNTYNNSTGEYLFQVDENGAYTIYARDKYGKEALVVIETIGGIGSDRLKFVLYWNGSVSGAKDLDSYMVIMDRDTKAEKGKVYYGNKTFNQGGTHVFLNQDVTSGSSLNNTEVLTLESANGEIFRYWVQNYSNQTNDNTALANSQPILKISRGKSGNEKIIYDSSLSGQGLTSGSPGTRWNVLEYDSTTRTLKWVNTLVNISEGFVEKEDIGE